VNPGCHQALPRRRACCRPCACGGLGAARRSRRRPPGAGEGLPGSRGPQPAARLPGPARIAQRDSALTHCARCQWISPSAARAPLVARSSQDLANTRCSSVSRTAHRSSRFQQSRTDFTAFESLPSRELPCWVFFA
uniref:Uncharacterized protein n=1 Tax=Marmota marmota marmota TaxID=9994 RepID=A0A8C6EP92_MARMA